MENCSLENLNLYFGLSIELFLIFNNFQSNVLALLMIIRFKNFAERSPAKNRDYFVFIGYRISHQSFRVSLAISKVLNARYSSWADKKNLVVLDLIFFKRS